MFKYYIVLIQIVLFCNTQKTFSKEISQYKNGLVIIKDLKDNNNEIKCILAIENSLDQRSIANAWNKIKQTAVNVWTSIEKLAEDTKNKIKDWIASVKEEAERIQKAIKSRLEDLKTKVIAAIQDAFNSEVAKKCFQHQVENIEKQLKKVVNGVTECISDKIGRLRHLEQYLSVMSNYTGFVIKIEAKYNRCVEKGDQIEECEQNIRKEIAYENNNMENEILKHRVELRRKADDILDAIATCSMQGLNQAVNVAATSALEIINCITKG